MKTHSSAFHSVGLYSHMCKGCTICVTGCPAEAIRVRNGKAVIMEERCIDCGECIRHCPNKAKYAASLDIAELQKGQRRAALLTPSFYGQFPVKYTADMIRDAVRNIGFTDVFDVADDTETVTRATAEFLARTENPPHPVISSSCPAVIKLIQIRFPSLIENLLPVLPPVEVTARRARKTLPPGSKIYLISPCPAKMTAARVPLGYDGSQIDGSFSVGTLYIAILSALKKNAAEPDSHPETDPDAGRRRHETIRNTTVWSKESGESECLSDMRRTAWISAGGIPQAISALEAIEAGLFSVYEFAEIAACNGGCLGGPLNITCVPEAQAIIRNRLQQTAHAEAHGRHSGQQQQTGQTPPEPVPDRKPATILQPGQQEKITFSRDIPPRPGRILDADFSKARAMLEKMERIIDELPGLDCGSCGAPNCRALAEDIVRGNAAKEDCVTIMKAQYETLLFGQKNGGGK